MVIQIQFKTFNEYTDYLLTMATNVCHSDIWFLIKDNRRSKASIKNNFLNTTYYKNSFCVWHNINICVHRIISSPGVAKLWALGWLSVTPISDGSFIFSPNRAARWVMIFNVIILHILCVDRDIIQNEQLTSCVVIYFHLEKMLQG